MRAIVANLANSSRPMPPLIPGNSGGALVNARGELIGINTFLISSSGSFSGMGFAIPTQIVQPTVETLIHDGKVTHAYIGVQISDVTPDNAKFFHMNKAEGALVSQVEPDAPGAKAGLRTGDVITELDGKPVTDAGELQMLVGQKRPGRNHPPGRSPRRARPRPSL